MTYILFCSAVIAGFLLKKSKICTAYMITVMLILAVYVYKCADIVNYENGYNNSLEMSAFRYIGFTSFLQICAKVGMSWIQFRWLFYVIAFALLIFGIRIVTPNINFVLSIYMITYYGIDVIQMKSFLADILSFFAIIYLIKTLSNKRIFNIWRIAVVFAVLIIAALIHFSAIFYLLATILYIFFYHRGNITKRIFTISVVLIVAVYMGLIGFVGQYAYQMGIIGDISYLETWFEKQTRYGYLTSIFFVLAIVLSCKAPKHFTDREANDMQPARLLRQYIMTALLLMPFLILNAQYLRLARVYVLLVLLSHAEEKIKLKLTRENLLSLMAYGVVLIMSVYDGTFMFFESTLGSILKYNSIL